MVVTVRELIGATPEFRKHCCDGAPGAVGSLLPLASTEKVNGASVIGIEPQPPAAPVFTIILGSFGDVPSARAEVETKKMVARNTARKITCFILSSKVDRGSLEKLYSPSTGFFKKVYEEFRSEGPGTRGTNAAEIL